MKHIDLLNEPFKLKIKKKVMLDRKLSGGEKSKIKAMIDNPDFMKNLKSRLNKSAFIESEIPVIIELLKGDIK